LYEDMVLGCLDHLEWELLASAASHPRRPRTPQHDKAFHFAYIYAMMEYIGYVFTRSMFDT